jgi:cobalt-zinc-cadmium efflux system membrane fusion protein
MNRIAGSLVSFLLVCTLAMSLHAAQGRRGHAGDAEKHPEAHVAGSVRLTPEQREAAGIETRALEPRAVATELKAPGEIQLNAYATAMVSPRIAAQVLERQARLGDRVQKGQALVTLSSVEMAKAQGELLVAELEWRRIRKLGQKVVSEQRYTEARVAREQARARVRAYGMTQADIDRLLDTGDAELADGRFQLRAPQDGTVIRDRFVFEISDESTLWVEARLTPDDAARVPLNARAIVTTREHRVEGRVTQIHHALDEDTRTLAVRIAIPNPEDRLHPGLFVEARIEAGVTSEALALPAQAVLRSPDGDWMVFVEQQKNRFEPREVEVRRTTDEAVVIDGIAPGSQVVTQGAFFLQSELAKSGFEVHRH